MAPDYAASFALESGSELSRADGGAARRAGAKKQQPLSAAQLQAWDERKREVMREALYAKFTQFSEMKDILLATRDAQLVHRPPRGKLVTEYILMEVRSQIQAEEGTVETASAKRRR